MIYESGDGGEIQIQNGDLVTTDAVFNQIYLGHFGGNTDHKTTGTEEEGVERFDFWGNSFLEEEAQFNSGLEKALKENPLSSAGRINIEREARKDLSFLEEIAEVTVETSIGLDKITLKDKVNQTVNSYIWDATKSEVIQEITI